MHKTAGALSGGREQKTTIEYFEDSKKRADEDLTSAICIGNECVDVNMEKSINESEYCNLTSDKCQINSTDCTYFRTDRNNLPKFNGLSLQTMLTSIGKSESELKMILNETFHEVDRMPTMGLNRQYMAGSFIFVLLNKTCYDNMTAPNIFPEFPVDVRIGVILNSLGDFDASTMQYSTDVDLIMQWRDVRLIHNYSKPIMIRNYRVIDYVWRPDPYFANAKEAYFHRTLKPNRRLVIERNGIVTYYLRLTLVPACLMIFCRYPHDKQSCDLRISLFASPRTEVQLNWFTNQSLTINPDIRFADLQLTSTRVTNRCLIPGKEDNDCLQLFLNLERNSANALWDKFIPSSIGVAFAWVAPWVPYDFEEIRIVTPITVLLTLFQMERGGDAIPRVSYITSLHIWFGAMKIFTVLSLFETVVVMSFLIKAQKMEKLARKCEEKHAEIIIFEEKAKYYRKMSVTIDNVSRVAGNNYAKSILICTNLNL